MWENADQNNSEYGHFLRRVELYLIFVLPTHDNVNQILWSDQPETTSDWNMLVGENKCPI